MLYRRDKKTGRELSALGLGCMRFSRNLAQIDYKKAERIILRAVEAGVNYFDTAYLYFGSEEVLGRALQENDLRDRVNIATKLPLSLCKGRGDFERLFASQLKKLRTGQIDYYLLHNLQDMATYERLKALGVEEWLAEKKSSGQIKQAGFSFHGAQAEFMSLLDAYDWDFCQIQLNYLNENYQAGTAGLLKAAEKGLSVIIMEPLLGGKLAKSLPQKAEELFKRANPGLTPAQWALRWLWNLEAVTVVLSGMNSLGQLEENLAAAEGFSAGAFGEAEKALFGEVAAVFEDSYKIPCTGCQYCMPCPKNVNIPGCFAAYNMRCARGYVAGMTMYIQDFMKRSPRNCVRCGKCEKACPQHIAVMDELQNVRKKMEPAVLTAGYKLFHALQPKP